MEDEKRKYWEFVENTRRLNLALEELMLATERVRVQFNKFAKTLEEEQKQ